MSAYVPPYIIRIIYFSLLFYSHLIYDITVWGACRVSNINKIIKLQRGQYRYVQTITQEIVHCNIPQYIVISL